MKDDRYHNSWDTVFCNARHLHQTLSLSHYYRNVVNNRVISVSTPVLVMNQIKIDRSWQFHDRLDKSSGSTQQMCCVDVVNMHLKLDNMVINALHLS